MLSKQPCGLCPCALLASVTVLCDAEAGEGQKYKLSVLCLSPLSEESRQKLKIPLMAERCPELTCRAPKAVVAST